MSSKINNPRTALDDVGTARSARSEITPSLSASEVIPSLDALAPEVNPQITKVEPIKVNPDGQPKPPETTVANPAIDSVKIAEPSLVDLIEPAEPVIEQAATSLSVPKNEIDRHFKAINEGRLPDAEQNVMDERTKKTVGTSLT